ncbi:pyridoxal kinase PdxY [Martelella alba]|uniref:pyridoxal kinase n=1 Tax=Martelella alba TaxID=2590451 RepID=A0A506UGG2_9HYPH|nr:pyridoxal kinase PdxY [Martelella alba]TPW31127.1 pyridoxal kinase PdxY [Martelella alba]
MINTPDGAIVAISSHVMRGRVGNRAIVFALEALGFNSWAIPTVILPFHPGHGAAARLTFDTAGFSAALDDLATSRWRGEVRAVVSGYLADAAQAEAIAGFIAALRKETPDLVYLCDPVIGDSGGLYVKEETAIAIRDRLLPLADIATPNRFELAWLTERPVDDNNAIINAALSLAPAAVAVTSAHAMIADSIATLYVDDRQAILAEHPLTKNPPNGLGDLFSGLFLARHMAGLPLAETLEKATASVFEVLAHAVHAGADELMLEKDQQSLRTPMVKVGLRQLMHPSRRRKRQ